MLLRLQITNMLTRIDKIYFQLKFVNIHIQRLRLHLRNFFRIYQHFCTMKRHLCFIWLFIIFASSAVAQRQNLDYYLSQANKQTPNLLNLQNQARSLGIDSLKLRASYGPQVIANSNLLYAPVIKGWGYDNAITNGQNVTGVVTVSKEIIGKNNLQTRLTNFSIQKQQLDNQTKLSKKTLEQTITAQYITAFGSQQRYLLAREIDTFLQTEDGVLRQLARTAVLKQTDYLTFKVALQQQQLTVQQVKTLFLNDLGTLNYLCGIDDSAWTELARPIIRDSALLPFEQTVYYQGSLLDSTKNNNDAQIINLNYKPQINVFADGGYQSSFIYQAHKNVGASIGLTMTLPIYDGKQKKYSLLQNKLLEDTRKKYTDFYHKQYNQQILQLTQQLEQYEHLIAEAAQQLLYSQTLVEANRKQLATGDVRITDYLLSVNNYLNLRSGMIQNDMIRLSLLNQIHNIILK